MCPLPRAERGHWSVGTESATPAHSYGNDMADVYRSTVLHGRPDKGMPVWGEILDGKTIDRIYAYLKSVQSEPE